MLNVQEQVRDVYEGLHDINCQGTNEDVTRIREKLELDPESLERPRMPLLSSPLKDAAFAGHYNCVRFLISRGALLDAEDRIGSTALDAAVCAGDLECVKLLLEAGANPNHRPLNDPRQNRTWCLTKACSEGRPDIVQALLEHGAMTEDIAQDFPNFLLLTPAGVAVSEGHPECLKLLLLHGAMLNIQQLVPDRPEVVAKNCLPHVCVCHAKRNLVTDTLTTLELLQNFGADFQQIGNSGMSALDKCKLLLMASDDEDSKYLNEIYVALKKIADEPLSLQAQSRISLIRHQGRSYLNNVNKFELPTSLHSYLQFSDISSNK